MSAPIGASADDKRHLAHAWRAVATTTPPSTRRAWLLALAAALEAAASREDSTATDKAGEVPSA